VQTICGSDVIAPQYYEITFIKRWLTTKKRISSSQSETAK
jgi:hypothetical protein